MFNWKKTLPITMTTLLIGASAIPATPVFASERTLLNQYPNRSEITNLLSSQPYAFPEEESGRVIEDQYKVTNKGQKITLASLTGSLSIYFSFAQMWPAAVITMVATNLIGAIDGTVAYMGETITEYYVYDFEGSVIGYKYYIDVVVYEDENYDKIIDDYPLVRVSVSPLSVEELRFVKK